MAAARRLQDEAKRAAYAAAMAPARPAPDASAARSQSVSVHLTEFAPGCAAMPIHDKRRWATFWSKAPSQIVRAALTRCGLPPGAVRAQGEIDGTVSLMAGAPPEVQAHLSSEPGKPVPFAVVDGLTADQVAEELDALRAADWLPVDLMTTPKAARASTLAKRQAQAAADPSHIDPEDVY